jgi:hypothetical protein
MPACRVDRRFGRPGCGRHFRRPQQGRTDGPHEMVATRPGPHRRPRHGSSPSRPRKVAASRPCGRYRFEPVEGGTRVTESYDVKWIPTWARIVDVPTNRYGELQEAMRHTLDQLKAAAEGNPEREPESTGRLKRP